MKKIKVTIPRIEDLTLGHYQEFMLGYSDDLSESDLDRLLISSFCELDTSVINLIPAKDINEIISHLRPILTRTEWPLVREFEIDGVEFGFIPNLEDATFGEWVDIDSYLLDVTNWHKLMAVFFRPIKERVYDRKLGSNRYNVMEYEGTKEYADAMLLTPLDAVFGSISFFVNIGVGLLKTIPSYLRDQMATAEFQHHYKDLVRNGDGTELSISLVEETLKEYETYLKSIILNASFFYASPLTKLKQQS